MHRSKNAMPCRTNFLTQIGAPHAWVLHAFPLCWTFLNMYLLMGKLFFNRNMSKGSIVCLITSKLVFSFIILIKLGLFFYEMQSNLYSYEANLHII